MPDRVSPDYRQAQLRALPSVSRLLALPSLQSASNLPPEVVTDAVRQTLAAERSSILAAVGDFEPATDVMLAEKALRLALRNHAPSLQGAINATGVVLHTGLGRARLAQSACEALAEVGGAHSLLEIDRETGRRGSRRDHVRQLLCELTGAEDAHVVNNCAGAVFLAVNALAFGREVIISRGELVEIGGAFRMPDIVRAGGGTLVEVGTTNRTRISDYENAITDRTGLILRCHPSNFAIIGFTEETSTQDLVRLGRSRNIPVMDDQGSGALLSPERLGLPPGKGSLPESVRAGADLVAASGDKLMGGPQAGVLLGSAQVIEKLVRHPLSRALRIDKLTLAALEATLRLYRDPERALTEIPTLRYLTRGSEEILRMARSLKRRIDSASAGRLTTTVVEESSEIGGGSLPGEILPTRCVAIRAGAGGPTPDRIAEQLRLHTPPIFARIRADAVLLDPRTLESAEFAAIAEALANLS